MRHQVAEIIQVIMKTIFCRWIFTGCLILFVLFSGEILAMNIFQNDFEKRWASLSKDVIKLNEYTAKGSIELSNVEASNLDLRGVVFNGAKISSINWENVKATKSKFYNVVFRNCTFTGGDFGNGTYIDVLFDDCEFFDTSYSGSKMENVRFLNCKIERTGIGYLEGGRVQFEGCNWDTGIGGMSQCHFEFRKSTIGGVMFMGMKGAVPLVIEDCSLDEVNFGKSHFSDVILRQVRQGEGPTRFNNATAKSIRFENVNMTTGVSLAHVTAESVVIDGGTFRGATEGSTIAKIYAHDANLFMYDMSEATMPCVNIWDCQIQNLAIWECFVKEFSIANSTIYGMDATDFKAETAVWDNITLDGKIDFSNAHIKDFRPSRIHRGSNLQLITAGSNVRI
jgi:uncharacterized protein YjbI with pentapeptide repeats